MSSLDDTVPIIDVADFGSDHWLPQMDFACREWGCFQIINHGVEPEQLAELQREIVNFFANSREAKRQVERTAENPWGFYDRELTKNVRDWKEIFDFGPAAAAGPLACLPQWPRGLTNFRPVMEAFFSECETIARKLLAGISRNLGMPVDYLGRGFGSEHSSFLRLNYYPPCAAPDQHFGISQHTDAGALTVLWQDQQAGLQFFRGDSWYTVTPVPGALLINIGDIVQVWSNDQYRAPLHRVLTSAREARYSAPFFFNPSYDTNYAPLPGVLVVAAPRYRSINWGEFRAGRAAGDYADVGEEIQIEQFRI
jgi:isopenicillin N synthase-like dioxygenase